MVLGILFDLYTRFNYLARNEGTVLGGLFGDNPIESLVLLAAVIVVIIMKSCRGIVSDSLRYTEAQTFAQTGKIASTLALSALVSIAAVGGRLYNEVVKLGWAQVTWAGDIAMLIVLLVIFSVRLLLVEYLMWSSYRKQEDRLAKEDE